MTLQNTSCMNQEFASRTKINDDSILDAEDIIDYENLITRLKQISKNIALLEKYINKF